MKHLLNLSLFLLFTLITPHNARAEQVDITYDGINYTFYYSGSGASAVGVNAVVTWHTSSFSGAANIASRVTYKYTYVSGYDNQGNPIYTTRNLTAPVTAIVRSAFSHSGLTSVTIPNSVTSIGEFAFQKTALTSITIPNSVTTIERYTFSLCRDLTSVTIPNSVTSIGDNAFESCSSLTNFTIPNSVTSIGYATFSGCSSLPSINIPNSVTTIGNYAFSGCSSLPSINIPNSVKSIGFGTFWGCSSLMSVTIPNSVTTIGGHAFYECSSLTSVTIPNSVTNIGDNAFESCCSLTSVTIPNSVTFIGGCVFYGCSNLSSITCLAETPPTAYTNSFSDYSATLHVPARSLNAYQTTSPWSKFYNIQPIGQAYSISLSPTSAVIEKGDFIYLKATVTPYDDYAPQVTWSSSNTAVATVDEWGMVTAVGTGNAVITARAGNASATCSVRVVAHTVTLDQSSVSIPIYSTVQLHATITPDDEYAPSVTWSSSHPGVATVTQSGLVKGYMTGTATITARAGQSTATCVVTVTPVLATGIALNASQLTMEVGEPFRLVATVYPGNVSNGAVAWMIPANDVVSASWNGNECVILAEKAGTVRIGARTTDGTNLTAYCTITVNTPFVMATSITIMPSNLTMNVNETYQLHATVLPLDATNKTVAWSSSNTSVATVTSNGVVRALKAGNATITASTTDGSQLTVQCKATVIGGDTPGNMPGDVNSDGKVDINDMTALINYLLTGDSTGLDLDNADVNGDGRVDISDVTEMINRLLNGTVTVLPGDADGDGHLTISDVTTLIRFLLSGNAEDFNLVNADVDGDGQITINDVTTLINKLLNHS